MRRILFGLVSIGLLVLSDPAGAVIIQIDGLVVPVERAGACPLETVRCCIGVYDPGGVVSPVLDARVYPGVFQVPCPVGCDRSECGLVAGCEFTDVGFEVLGEGGGYRNSFGWYNVGDDVTAVANLHGVLGCRTGSAAIVCPAGAAYRRPTAIDFQHEFEIGNYDGGFIGMWMRTPELLAGGSDGDNCGGWADTANRIYFTEQALNDDGDFVHYLVWESATLDETYYFGWEDLFRGGDNDFEDMFFVATGLVPPCDPQPETCDGVDNDCDLEVDEGLTRPCASSCGPGVEVCEAGAWGACDAPGPGTEVCDGDDDDCDGDIDEGLTRACESDCGSGSELCFFGAWVGCDATLPAIEVCDTVDNDCDGSVDESDPHLGEACGEDRGACEPGATLCDEGELVCDGGTGPVAEACNGVDDDCDGDVDENNPGGGGACGEEEGECRPGVEECIAGDLVCTGGRGPIDEVCNGLDDDCDGADDDGNPGGGAPCGSDVGACDPGILTCVVGSFECEGSTGPVPEECNGVDDDCDGVIDDLAPRDCEAGCGPGNQICVDGEWGPCLGPSGNPEVCNGIDDDCDGEIDEGFDPPLCPEEGSTCVEGECALPCASGEFQCPTDKVCVDGYCVSGPCRDVECPAGQFCQDGECVDLCGAVRCSAGFVCNLGLCVEDSCYGLGCEPGLICRGGECVANPCALVDCADGEFCRDGACVASCAGVDCGAGRSCRDGACVDDPCAGLWCPPGEACAGGRCVDDPCAGVDCRTGRVCQAGACVDDPCLHVTCPGAQVCQGGDCWDSLPAPPARPDRYGLATGGGISCTCASAVADGAPRAPWLALLLAAAGLVAMRRRRDRGGGVAAPSPQGPLPRAAARGSGRGRAQIASAILAAIVFVAGCEIDPYCFTCDDDGGGGDADGDGDGDADGDGDGDGGPTDGCVYEGDEACDGRDNDCDGATDEGFDVAIDPANCGACGVLCVVPHAFPACAEGGCRVERCDVGWVDLDRLPGNGCEYSCLGSGSEVCDGLDNDCDGAADEGFDLDGDLNNCGSCGRACAFYHAAADCVAGDCVMGECDSGFIDDDGDPDTGCEYNCAPSGSGETCDGRDNDCDGEVDEGIDLLGSAENCGHCGRECRYLNAAGLCVAGDCALGECDPGWIDLDEIEDSGCEYPCAGEAQEVCDGEDNDCDGLTDETDPDVGTACGTSAGECVAGEWSCRVGRLVCEGGSSARPEACDGLDNDCDGVDDDGNPGGGARCGLTNVGACEFGSIQCEGAELVCGGALVEATDEACNGADDDCDGEVDEGVAPRACTTRCGAGTERCSAGAWVDCSAPPEVADLCDGLDTDCDGAVDPGCPVLGPAEVWVEGTAANTVFPSLASDGASRALVAFLERPGADATVRVAGTANQATTWASPASTRLDSNAAGLDAMSPVVAMAGSRAYVAWEDTRNGSRRSIYLRRSTDGGASWVAGETRLDTGLDGDSFDIDVAATGADVYVVWQEMDWADRSRAVYLAASGDGGATFAAPVRVDHHPAPSTGIAREPSVAAGPGGRVYVTFSDNRAGPGAIFVNASDDGGATWLAADVRVDPAAVEAESQAPVIAADGAGRVVVAWEDEAPEGADTAWKVMAAVSSDHGESFDPAERLDDDPLPHDSRDAAIAIDPAGAAVHVVWRDMRNGFADIYAQRLDVAALAWAAGSTRVDTDEDGVGNSTAPRVAAGADGRVWVVWEDDRAGQRDVYVNFSLDGGEVFQPVDLRLDTDAAGAADSHDPRVAVTADRAVVVWVDHRAGAGTAGDLYARYLE